MSAPWHRKASSTNREKQQSHKRSMRKQQTIERRERKRHVTSKHCRNKRGYLNRAAAYGTLSRLRATLKVADTLTVYHCRWCGLFHAGNEKEALEGPG